MTVKLCLSIEKTKVVSVDVLINLIRYFLPFIESMLDFEGEMFSNKTVTYCFHKCGIGSPACIIVIVSYNYYKHQISQVEVRNIPYQFHSEFDCPFLGVS